MGEKKAVRNKNKQQKNVKFLYYIDPQLKCFLMRFFFFKFSHFKGQLKFYVENNLTCFELGLYEQAIF